MAYAIASCLFFAPNTKNGQRSAPKKPLTARTALHPTWRSKSSSRLQTTANKPFSSSVRKHLPTNPQSSGPSSNWRVAGLPLRRRYLPHLGERVVVRLENRNNVRPVEFTTPRPSSALCLSTNLSPRSLSPRRCSIDIQCRQNRLLVRPQQTDRHRGVQLEPRYIL